VHQASPRCSRKRAATARAICLRIHVATLVGLDTPLGRVAAAFREREGEQTHRLALVKRGWMNLFGGAWTPSLLARVDTLASRWSMSTCRCSSPDRPATG